MVPSTFKYNSIYLDKPIDVSRRRVIDIFQPENPLEIAIFLVHGGGWTAGCRTGYHLLQEAFCNNSYISASAAYRLADPSAGINILDQLTDLHHAYDEFLRFLHSLKPLKTPRIVVMGSSAGAHLANMLAWTKPGQCGESLTYNKRSICESSPRPSALISVCGPVTLEPWDEINPRLLEACRNGVGADWEMASIIHRGLLLESSRQHAEVAFLHFSEFPEKHVLDRQLMQLQQFDGAAFIGDQLEELRSTWFKSGGKCLQIKPASSESKPWSVVDNDAVSGMKELADYLHRRNYQHMTVLAYSENDLHLKNQIIEDMKEVLDDYNIAFDKAKDMVVAKDFSEKSIVESIRQMDLQSFRTAIFCRHGEMLKPLSLALLGMGLQPGVDVGIWCRGRPHAEAMVYDRSYCYLDSCNEQLGRLACRTLTEIAKDKNNEQSQAKVRKVPCKLVIGQTL